MNMEYADCAREYNHSLREGHWERAISELHEMARIRRDEGCSSDEMKLLILAFHLASGGLTGTPYIDRFAVVEAAEGLKSGRFPSEELGQLYLDAIREHTLPVRTITPNDGLYLFTLCINGRTTEAEAALQRFYPPSL